MLFFSLVSYSYYLDWSCKHTLLLTCSEKSYIYPLCKSISQERFHYVNDLLSFLGLVKKVLNFSFCNFSRSDISCHLVKLQDFFVLIKHASCERLHLIGRKKYHEK
jgi:hypothetical protein